MLNTQDTAARETTLQASAISNSLSNSADASGLDSVRSWYTLMILTLCFSMAYVDRQVLNLLVDPIRHSLAVSDTQLSLIQGLAFVSAYLIASPTLGRLVDTRNRRNILIVGIVSWSLFTILCGRADTYLALFIARFGVGASEACVFPVGCSIIADVFTARRTPLALSCLVLAPLIGGGCSLLAGGVLIASAKSLVATIPVLHHFATWQLTFIMVGLPGFVVAVWIALTMREPHRIGHLSSDDVQLHSVKDTAMYLWHRKAFYARTYIAIAMIAVVIAGSSAWLPSLLIRRFGMAPASVGIHFGMLVIVFGVTGVLSGPWLTRWFERRGHRDAPLRAGGFSMVGLMGFSCMIPLARSSTMALIAAAGIVFFFSIPTGILAGALQLAAPSRMRGVVGGVQTFFSQLFGFGFGPTSIAMVTEYGFHDQKALPYAIGIVCATAAIFAATLLFTATAPYRKLTASS